jgi:plasmid stabilization system protein ParE
MKVEWSDDAVTDLDRLYNFLADANPAAAAKAVVSLTAVPNRLVTRPRMGRPIDRYAPREVRRLIVGPYELRYEVSGSVITVLHLWHTREDR